jgi:hypothetical protein
MRKSRTEFTLTSSFFVVSRRPRTFYPTVSSSLSKQMSNSIDAAKAPTGPEPDHKVVLARLKAITYCSGRAYVALSKGDTAAYLSEIAHIEQSLAAIHAQHRLHHEVVRYHTEENGE